MKGEFYDPVASAFRIKLEWNGVLVVCRFRGRRGLGLGEGSEGGGGGGGVRVGGSKSFVSLHFVCRSVLSLWLSERLVSSTCPLGCLQGHRAAVLMLV